MAPVQGHAHTDARYAQLFARSAQILVRTGGGGGGAGGGGGHCEGGSEMLITLSTQLT